MLNSGISSVLGATPYALARAILPIIPNFVKRLLHFIMTWSSCFSNNFSLSRHSFFKSLILFKTGLFYFTLASSIYNLYRSTCGVSIASTERETLASLVSSYMISRPPFYSIFDLALFKIKSTPLILREISSSSLFSCSIESYLSRNRLYLSSDSSR